MINYFNKIKIIKNLRKGRNKTNKIIKKLKLKIIKKYNDNKDNEI